MNAKKLTILFMKVQSARRKMKKLVKAHQKIIKIRANTSKNKVKKRIKRRRSKTVEKKKYVASSFLDLIFSPMPKNCSLSCLITCKEEILSLTRSYDLYLIKEKKKILTALRSKIQMTSSFDIFGSKGEKQIGMIKGNFTGT